MSKLSYMNLVIRDVFPTKSRQHNHLLKPRMTGSNPPFITVINWLFEHHQAVTENSPLCSPKNTNLNFLRGFPKSEDMSAWGIESTVLYRTAKWYFCTEYYTIFISNRSHVEILNAICACVAGTFSKWRHQLRNRALAFWENKKMAADLKRCGEMCSIDLIVLYENDRLFIKYSDGSSIELSACGSAFVHRQTALSSSAQFRQLTRFAVSSFRSKIKEAIRIRNLFAARPYLCKELTDPQDLKVCWSTIAVNSFSHVPYFGNFCDFSVSFIALVHHLRVFEMMEVYLVL